MEPEVTREILAKAPTVTLSFGPRVFMIERWGYRLIVDEENLIDLVDQIDRHFEGFIGIPRTVIDIGAHIGLFSLCASALGASQILAYEPSHMNFYKMILNISANNLWDRITPIKMAVTSTNYSIRTLYTVNSNNPSMQSLLFNSDYPGHEVITQDFYGIMGVFDEIDILKIDVEGAEWEFFNPCTELRKVLERTKRVCIETHSLQYDDFFHKETQKLEAENSTENLIEFMVDCGFHNLKFGRFDRNVA